MKKMLSLSWVLLILLSACSPAATPAAPTAALKPPKPASTQPQSATGVLLFTIGMHIEPQGITAQGIEGGKGDYTQPAFFQRGIEDIQAVANMVAAHGGRMTVQAQSPFTSAAIANRNPVLADLAKAGHEIALHFHEDAHLGKNSETANVERWCAVMKEEIALVRQTSGVSEVRYWSGGNLYPQLFEAAACAGLSINSDWKNPQTQTTDPSLTGIRPWRPSGGTDGKTFTQFAAHNPAGKVIFLPEGLYDRNNFAAMRRSEDAGGDQPYFDYLKQALLASVAAAETGKVNVFHFTVHPGEFRGSTTQPFAVIQKFLSDVVDPLVKQGKVQWATFSQMASAYAAWEKNNPGKDMR